MRRRHGPAGRTWRATRRAASGVRLNLISRSICIAAGGKRLILHESLTVSTGHAYAREKSDKGGGTMLLRSLTACALSVLLAAPVGAQMKAPKGPVEITVGSGPGGTPDVIMRNIVKIMTEEKIVTIPVVVQNRPGGSHSNAYNYVLGKKGDESVLLTLA